MKKLGIPDLFLLSLAQKTCMIGSKSFLRFLVTTAIVSTILMWGCNKMNTTKTPPKGPNQSTPVEYVSATVTGRVIDENNHPVSGASIRTAFASTTTDVNGQFILSNIQLDKNAGYIIAQKSGYFNGSKTFELITGSSNYAEIELIAKNISGQFTATSGGNVTISNGGNIQFAANTIVDSLTNSPYSGIVTVYAYYLNPSMGDFGNIMPGKLTGISNDSSEKSLQSYGMIVAELTGTNGQRLQLAKGKTATISFPVQSAMISTAPSKIPLWYFDEIKGLWREQDSALLQGNNYIANVSHFSFWNCDQPFPLVHFQVLVDDKNNNPLSAVKVGIIGANGNLGIAAYGYTNSNGILIASIPANMNLTLMVFDHCDNLAFSQDLTTTDADVNLGTINANVQSIPVTFSGTLSDCTGAAVKNGDIRIFLDGFFTDANINNGTFSVTVNRCYSTSTSAQITAGDLSSNLDDTLTLNNITNLDVNSIKLTACNQSNQYIYYTLKGATDTLALAGYSFYDLINYDETVSVIATGYNNPANYFHIYFDDSTAINSPQTRVLISLTNYDSSYSTNTLTLSEFGNVSNGYIAGTFTGKVDDRLNGYALVPITGGFRIKRTK